MMDDDDDDYVFPTQLIAHNSSNKCLKLNLKFMFITRGITHSRSQQLYCKNLTLSLCLVTPPGIIKTRAPHNGNQGLAAGADFNKLKLVRIFFFRGHSDLDL